MAQQIKYISIDTVRQRMQAVLTAAAESEREEQEKRDQTRRVQQQQQQNQQVQEQQPNPENANENNQPTKKRSRNDENQPGPSRSAIFFPSRMRTADFSSDEENMDSIINEPVRFSQVQPGGDWIVARHQIREARRHAHYIHNNNYWTTSKAQKEFSTTENSNRNE